MPIFSRAESPDQRKIRERAEAFERDQLAQDPSLKKAPEEASAEEGDWLDYLAVNPASLAKAGVAAIGSRAAREGMEEIGKLGAKALAQNTEKGMVRGFTQAEESLMSKLGRRMPEPAKKITERSVPKPASAPLDYSKIGHKPTWTETVGEGGKNIGKDVLKKRKN